MVTSRPGGGSPENDKLRLGQPVGQFRWNAIGRETLRFVRLGILERAGDRVLTDDEVGNLSLVDQLLELTIGNGFGQRPLHQKVLDQHHRDHRTRMYQKLMWCSRLISMSAPISVAGLTGNSPATRNPGRQKPLAET